MHRQKTSFLSRGIHPGTLHLILSAACLAGSSLESRAELGLAREAYGVWDRTGYHSVTQYPFTRGQAFSDTWFNVNSARNVFNWAPMGAQLAFADAQNQMFNIQISTVGGAVGASMPSWMLDVNGGDVPSLTDGTFTYGYYLNPSFKVYYEEMVKSLANYVRNVLPPSLQARIAFVRVDTGATGDEEPYENANLIPSQYSQYLISPEQWLAHRLWAFEVYRKAFQEGPGPVIPLLFGSVEPPARQTEWDWVTTNVLGGYGVKFGGTVRGHHLTDSRQISDVFKPLAVDPAPGVKLFSRNEMDGSWTWTFFQQNIKLSMYWAAVEQLNAGMSVWDPTGSCLENAYIDGFDASFEFFNQWAAELIPTSARGGFSIFHEGLDSSDGDKFPTTSFGGGSVSQGNTARYTAICNAYSAQGAQMDDLYAATRGAVWQRPNQVGYNDAGWQIQRGNYERFITQISPGTTSLALWRVNGPLTSSSHPYDRFARRFDNASGRNTMYFDIHDNLLPSPGQRVEFSVDYLDRGTGQFALQYDAVGNSQQTAFTVTKTNTNIWMTASVVVTDWVCANNGPNGADFMLLNVDSDDDIFHRVEVTKFGAVTLNKVGQGSVNARNDGYSYDPLGGVIEQNLRLDLSVTPAQGWEFASWSGDLTGTNTRPIIFVGQNTQITANFGYTGNYATGDDFEMGTWSGGSSNWSGPWIPSGTAAPGQVAQLTGNANLISQITRTLTTPIPNAILSFDWDLDRIATSQSGTVEVQVGNSWIMVWTQNLKGTDLDASAQLVTATLNLSSYGSISGVRFTLNANGTGDRFWLDNVNITGSVTVYPPVFTANPFSKAGATQDAAYNGQTLAGTAADQNGDPLTYLKVSGPAWLSVAASGTLTGTPDNSDVGNNSWTVQVSDGLTGTATATLNIAVANVNDAPVFTVNPIAGAGATQGVAYSGTLTGSASDADAGDTLSYSKVSGPAWLQVETSGALTGTPGNSNVGANAFVVRVTDAAGASVEATLNIAVANVNDAPVFTVNPIAGAGATQGVAYSGTLTGSASDADAGDTLSYSKVSGPAWLQVATNGSLTGTPGNSNVGANAFVVRVSDAAGATVEATLNIAVANVNDAPVFTVNPMSRAAVTSGTAYNGQTLAGSATDVDAGDVLTYSKVSGPAWLNIATSGALTGTPGSANVGANSWTVQVSDGIVSVTAVLNITVNPAAVQKTSTFVSVGGEDGYVLESSETSNLGGSLSATNNSTSSLRIGDETTKKQYKTVVSFDTSSLPDGATIISATLKLKRGTISTNPSGLGTINVDIIGGSGFGGATALANGDFQAAAGANSVSTMSYPSSNGALSTGSLNSTGLSLVNKTGKTQFRVQFATDDNNDNKADYLGFYSGENSTTANRPVLEIIYQ